MVIVLSIFLGIFAVAFGVSFLIAYRAVNDLVVVEVYTQGLERQLFETTQRQTYVEDWETFKWNTRDSYDPEVDRILAKGEK